MILPKTTKSSTAPACPVPCPRPRQRQAPRPSHDCCSTAPVAKLICDADFLGDAPSKFTCEQKTAGNAIRKRRPGSRYLSVVVSADGIFLRHLPAANRSGGELATYLLSTIWCHIDVEEALSADRRSSILGNHDEVEVPPLQCWAKRENDSRPLSPRLFFEDSIVQFHLFEYEMSRGLQVLGERNKT